MAAPAEKLLIDNTAGEAPRTGEYVVVARRYRPQSFDELIGQDHVARALKGAIAAGRVGHAYLFTGARGVGKTSSARILAKSLNCIHGPTATPCNVCEICRDVTAGSDVDVIEIDGASNRGIEEIRTLRQNVNVRPSRARFKIYIIDEVHMLTREAFNALLKTLEEPPEHVKFIFCTTEASKIPITILSRCQRFDFAGIHIASIVERLRQIVAAEGVEAEPEALTILARRAAGSMRDSQSLLEQILAVGGERITATDVHALLGTAGEARLTTLVDSLLGRDAAAAIGDLDSAANDGVDVGQLLEQLLGYFRDVMVAAVGCPVDALLHTAPAQHPHLAEAGRRAGLETILAIMQIIDHTLSRMRYSTQSRTLVEMALVRIASLENLDDLSDLIQRLKAGELPEPSGTPAARDVPAAADPTAKKKGELVADRSGPTGRVPTPQQPIAPATLAPAEVTSGNAKRIWDSALARLEGLLHQNAEFCENASAPGGNRLVATFRTKYTACRAFCERHAAEIEDALSSAASGRVKLEFATNADELQQVAAQARRAAPQRQRVAELKEHAMVRLATELFDAQIVRVEDSESAN